VQRGVGGEACVQASIRRVSSDFTRNHDFLRERGCRRFAAAPNSVWTGWLTPETAGWTPFPPPRRRTSSSPATGGRNSCRTRPPWIALIRALFTHCLDATEILAIDDPICREIPAAPWHLRPPGITRDGRLREWVPDDPEQDRTHRHLSPMVAVYPLGRSTPSGHRTSPPPRPDCSTPAGPAPWDGPGPGRSRCGPGWATLGRRPGTSCWRHRDRARTARIRHGRTTVDLTLDTGEEVRLGPGLSVFRREPQESSSPRRPRL
jgi:hypothetical protein